MEGGTEGGVDGTRPGEDSAPRASFSKIPSRDSGPGLRLNPQGESGPSVLRAQEVLFRDEKFPVEAAGRGSEAAYCSVRLRTMTGKARALAASWVQGKPPNPRCPAASSQGDAAPAPPLLGRVSPKPGNSGLGRVTA